MALTGDRDLIGQLPHEVGHIGPKIVIGLGEDGPESDERQSKTSGALCSQRTNCDPHQGGEQ